jgi:vancomycin permeability regulator SanA
MEQTAVPDATPQPAAAAATGTSGVGWVGSSVVRGLALFVGLFLVAGFAGALRHEGSQESLWLFDAGGVPGPGLIGPVLLAVAGLVLVGHGARPAADGWRRTLTAGTFVALALVALVNVVTFYRVWAAGEIDPRVPLPLSLLLFALMAWCAYVTARGPAAPAARPSGDAKRSRARLLAGAVILLTLAACLFLFPLAQIAFLGTTDYRRPADVAVVFGAQVHPGGAPSQTLAWRVDTACELYEDGLVERLVMSGGVGDTGYDEGQVMRDRAIERGVPASAIIVDSQGLNTEATVTNTTRLMEAQGLDRVLAVSNAYHLPRIKLEYRRQGLEVFTVPAEETRRIKETPRLWLREVPAFWVYYLRGFTE